MKRVMIIFAALIGAMSTFAADENDQLLVFRNTGEVNLFYASEVDSIVCSYMDADSIVYDVLVSQVFYAKDTTLYVPIEEIDSVTYGCRNAMEYKKDAMAIDATHLEWIESYDGTYIHYKAHTPANIIPKEGTGLFFPAQESDIFPNGLCAKVEQVNGTIVCVRKAEFDEVFDELFWAGELEVEIPSATRAEFETYVSLNKKMKLGNGLSFNMSGGTSIVATFVVQPRRHYYHGKIELKGANVTYSAALNMTDVAPYEVQEEIVDIPMGTILGILFPKLDFHAFLAINAELSFNYRMSRDFSQTFEMTRHNGEFSYNHTPKHENVSDGDKAQIDITLNGSLYLGIGTQFELGLPFETLGGSLKLRFGPEFSGQFGIGMLTKLDEYDPEAYGKARLSMANKLSGGLYSYRKGHIIWGEVVEDQLFSFQMTFNKSTLDLFPEYEQTRSVGVLEKKEDNTVEADVSMATSSTNEIVHSVEMGFEVLTEDSMVVEEIWVDSIYASETPADSIVQDPPQVVDTMTTIIVETEEKAKTLILQPIFRYAGYVVKARPVPVMTDAFLQPVIFQGSNGATSVLSGYPFIGERTTDSIHYTIGAFLPTIPIKTISNTTPPIISNGTYIKDDVHALLITTWTSDVDAEGASIGLSFIDSETGTLTQDGVSTDFTYTINQPQSGDVLLSLANGETLVFTIVSMDDESLTIRFKKDAKEYTLIKQ